MTIRTKAGRALGVAMIVAALPLTATIATDSSAITLDVGTKAHWKGPMVELAGLGSDDGSGAMSPSPGVGAASVERCLARDALKVVRLGVQSTTTQCYDYELDVAEGGALLRVAVDHPSNFDGFAIALTDPEGEVVATDSGEALTGLPAQNLYAAEVTAAMPRAGRWTATIVASDVRRSAFRVRAALEPAAAPAPSTPVALLPNLRVVPPFQVGFGPCTDAEKDAYDAVRCLRFSEGPENVGVGPLDLLVDSVGEPGKDANGQDSLVGTQRQRIHYSNGTTTTVDAGSFEYHLAHGHYHHGQTGSFELLKVINAHSGRMTPAGTGPKQGFCMGDYLISEWESFRNAPRRKEADYLGRPNCAVPTPGASHQGITAGWGDVYVRWTEGQYVEFGDNTDGLYVVRAQVNPDASITESDLDDNSGYAYIRVCGSTVSVIERGIGTDPWDKDKTITSDDRQPTMSSPKTHPAPLAPAGSCEGGNR